MRELEIWTVYYRPIDYPEKVVARRFTLDGPTEEVIVHDDLTKVRGELVVRGLARVARHPDDAPQIIECWL